MKLMIKYISLFVLMVTIFSCSSTKKIVEEKESTPVIVETPSEISTPPITEQEPEEVIDPPTEVLFVEKFDHTIFDELLQQNVSEKGNTNYQGFIKEKKVFKTYLTALSENMPTENWTKEDKLAYWMNVYNAFTIKLIIDNYPTKSIKDVKDAWSARFFKLGKKWYNLSDVEHKVLRKMNDSRIHFGINCASFSCPPLLNKAFTAKNVNDELDILARKFVNNEQYNTITENKISLSKIFQWYAKDFKTNGSLIDYLNKYSEITISEKAKKSFKKYNWNLNE